jgi:phosphate-selective porin
MSTASSVTILWYSDQYSFEIAASGPGVMALQELGEHPHARVPHDLHLRVRPRELLADDRVVGHAALLGEQQEAVDLGLEADRLRGRRLAALEAEQRHRHRASPR